MRIRRSLLLLVLPLLCLATPAVARAAGPATLPGARLYVDPRSPAHAQAERWRASAPADALLMDRLAAQPTAAWLGDFTPHVRAEAERLVRRARAAGAVPVLVAYDIPDRDCGSGGGAPDGAAYRAWMGKLARGLTGARAAIVLEPDALAGLACLSAPAQAARLRLLAWSVRTLRATSPRLAIYLDAGHSAWQPPAVMAARLVAAGVRQARGFSLNVANFQATPGQVAYGHALARRLPGTRFVVDTSRNGQGPAPDGAWCNPPGRGLGRRPSTRTGDRLVDAFLWIKPPGVSDGPCAGGPSAGAWWPEYALGLAQRAANG
jgi:endoglucanase